MTELCAHGPLTRVADGVWCMVGDAQSLERPRKMTAFVLPSGRLVLHSGIRLRDDEMQTIDSLGPLGYYLLVPNPHHDPDAGWFAERYPEARFIAPSTHVDRFRTVARVDGTFENDWPSELSGVLEHHTIAGARFTETVLFHVPSRTLVVVDLAFHLTAASLEGKLFARVFMKLNNAYDRFGITRLTGMLVADPAAFRRSLERILAWDFDRIIVSHGESVGRDGKRLFRAGFPKFLPPQPSQE